MRDYINIFLYLYEIWVYFLEVISPLYILREKNVVI